MRNSYLDNAKVILIFLVVYGHFLIVNNIAEDLFWTIYLFHMPAFILIAGYFDKKRKTKELLKNVALTCLMPYAIFQVIHNIIRVVFMNQEMRYNIFEPNYTLWFLLALAGFKIVFQLFVRFPIVTLVLFTIHFLCFDLYVENVLNFGMSRFTVFFYFYILGYLIKKRIKEGKITLKKMNHRYRYILGISILMIIFLIKILCDWHFVSDEWIQGNLQEDDYYNEMSQKTIILMRLQFLGWNILAVLGFFLIVPQKENRFTKYGKETLAVFLLHGIIIKVMVSLDLMEYPNTIQSCLYGVIVTMIIFYLTTRKEAIRIVQKTIGR